MIIKLDNFSINLKQISGDISFWLSKNFPKKKDLIILKAKELGYEITPVKPKNKTTNITTSTKISGK